MASSSDDVGSEKERFEVQHLALARWPTPGTQRARKLWQAELEFVQSLANPEYLHCAPTRSPRALATPPPPPSIISVPLRACRPGTESLP